MTLTQKQRQQILNAIRKRVLKHHFNAAGVNYDDWLKSFDQGSSDLFTVDHEAFEIGVQELLKELRSSHTGFYHEQPNRLLPQHTINATGFVAKFDGDLNSRYRGLTGVEALGSDAKQVSHESCLCHDVLLGHPSHSSFANHAYRFDAFQSSPGTLKRFIALGQPGALLYDSVILFNDIV
jgi:hypothetical protein